jgi:hypothetical protein
MFNVKQKTINFEKLKPIIAILILNITKSD